MKFPGGFLAAFVFLALFSSVSLAAPQTTDWYMAGANPQRTSWVSEEVRGNLQPIWYQPIEPYIPSKIQPVFYGGLGYVATARGLYVFNLGNAVNGQSRVAWVYPTELPLGQAPTIAEVAGKVVAYTPSYDHKIHAIDTSTHTDLAGYVPFEAGAGFDTNPLVVSDSFTNGQTLVIAGNRDGNVYAFDAVSGSLKWKFQTDGPVSASAAYKNGSVYAASQDMFVYSINIQNGALKWKSAKLGGQGLFTYWPVVYANKSTGKDYIFVNTGANYRSEYWMAGSDPGGETDVFGNTGASRLPNASGISGDWASGTSVMDGGIILDYYADKPYHRTEYVLDAGNGSEYSFTYNGKKTYAPFSYSGVTRGGSKFPGIVNGNDGVFYGQTAYTDYNGWISRGAPVGWKFGTQYLSNVANNSGASDEPSVFSSGGNVIYFTLCCDRFAVGFDVRPNQGGWTYWGYNMANNSLVPGYQEMYNDGDAQLFDNLNGWQVYAGKNQSHNGVYGKHGMNQSAPVPYQGKLYFLRGNSLLAFSPSGTASKTPLPLATIVPGASVVNESKEMVTAKLEAEVQKMITTGHLRPGFAPQGFYDFVGLNFFSDDEKMGELFDYFQSPGDTVATLLLSYPYLSAGTQSQVKTYLQNFYGPGKTYDFTKIVHVGWGSGGSREWADNPADWQSFENSVGKGAGGPLNPSTMPMCGEGCSYWKYFPPFNFYAAWKYAQIVGNGDVNMVKQFSIL